MSARIVGGRLSDRFGGGPVIAILLGGMIVAGGFVAGVGTDHDLTRGPGNPATLLMMIGYVVGFLALFVVAGAGKAAVYKLIPSVFEARSRMLGIGDDAERSSPRSWPGGATSGRGRRSPRLRPTGASH